MSKKASGGDNPLRKALEDITPRAMTDEQTSGLAEAEAMQGFPAGGALRSAAEAWSAGEPELSPVLDAHALGADLGNPSGAFLAGKLAQDAQLLAMATMATGNQPHMREVAERVFREARQLSKKQQGGEPTRVKIGNRTVAIPASVIHAPAALHESNADLADRLFGLFCKGKTKMIMENAAKCGHPMTPFCYLTQKLWLLLEIQGFRPSPRLDESGERKTRKNNDEMLDGHFDTTDATKGDPVRVALECWAGPELAYAILQKCHAADMDLLSGLKACYTKLNDDRLAELSAAQKQQTARQWMREDEDDDE